MPSDHQIQTILPKSLSPGDNIGIIAPASPFDKNKFLKGIAVLESIGFKTVFSQKIFEAHEFLAGSDPHRAHLLNSMFADPSIKAIWCARGGYGSLRILPLIDYNIVRSNPKVFIGCSDISAILNIFLSKCGMVTFHGPMIESLGYANKQTIQALNDILLTDQPLTLKSENKFVISSGTASGIVAGGNLTTLCHLTGTPFSPNLKKKILLIEDVGEAPYRIDRMLTQMKLAGSFRQIAGVILGLFKNCGESDQIYRIVDDAFSDFHIPVLAGFNIGHDEPNLTVPIGIKARIDTDKGCLSYLESPFRT